MIESHSPIESIYNHQSEIVVTLTLEGSPDTEVTLRLYRINPFGIELILSDRNLHHYSIYQSGKRANLLLTLGSHSTRYKGIVVSSLYRERGKSLIALRWIDSSEDFQASSDKRTGKRWLCSDAFLPIGFAPNPVCFNDFIHLKLTEISQEGLQFTTHLRTKTLLKGMSLESSWSFPWVGKMSLVLKVENSHISTHEGKEVLSLGASYLSPDPTSLAIIRQYILQFSLRNRDTAKPDLSLASGLTYSYAKTESDFREVLELRNKSFGKGSDAFDARSHSVLFRKDSKLVASMRVAFHTMEDVLEHEHYVDFPKEFPPKHEIAEVTKICTDPESRSPDLMSNMVRLMTLLVAQAGRRWILASVDKRFVPFYEKIGFDELDVAYSHFDGVEKDHVLMWVDLPRLLCGQNIGPITWKRLYADFFIYFAKQHTFEMSPLDRVRVSLYKIMGMVLR